MRIAAVRVVRFAALAPIAIVLIRFVVPGARHHLFDGPRPTATRTDHIDQQEGQPDEADDDTGDGKPHLTGDQTEDEQHEPDEGRGQSQGQHVTCLVCVSTRAQLGE